MPLKRGATKAFALENIERRSEVPEAPGGEHRFRLLLDAVKDYAIFMLDADGRVASWNSGAERLKSYNEAEILGQYFGVFYTEADRAAGAPEQALHMAAQTGRHESEGWRVRKDGARFWTSVVITSVLQDDRLIGFAKVTRDLTESRVQQAQIDAAHERLAKAQKMEAIGRLTGGVAHDFNNLLTVIRCSADLLRRPDLNDERRQRYVAAIAETADRAALITSRLLAYAQRQPLQPEPFDVADRLAAMAPVIAATLRADVAVRVDIAAGLEPVLADADQFQATILNLVSNASDAMSAGGQLTISASTVDRLPADSGRLVAEGAFVAIAVEDSGEGIEDHIMARLFEPFFTTKTADKGAGLGLCQAYGFAQQSGGDLNMTSTLGVGSAFTLYLPCAGPREAAPSPLVAADAPCDPAAGKSVLLVEDNEMVGRFAVSLLTELGQAVTWAANGQAALTILEQGRCDFDLVFSDVMMPGVNGVDLAKQIRARWPDIRVVLTSGYSQAIAQDSGHGFAFLQKPYSIDSLLRVLGGRASDPRASTPAAVQ